MNTDEERIATVRLANLILRAVAAMPHLPSDGCPDCQAHNVRFRQEAAPLWRVIGAVPPEQERTYGSK